MAHPLVKRLARSSGLLRRRFGASWHWTPWEQKCYSQEGEDQILRRMFEKKNTGFFVDVGAHHPIRFSNTYFFYRKGWSGVNIDATPGSMVSFDKLRARDTNIECGIDEQEDVLDFYCFSDS